MMEPGRIKPTALAAILSMVGLAVAAGAFMGWRGLQDRGPEYVLVGMDVLTWDIRT